MAHHGRGREPCEWRAGSPSYESFFNRGCPRLAGASCCSTLYGALSLSRGPSRPTCLQVSGKYQFPFSLARAQVRFCETHATL